MFFCDQQNSVLVNKQQTVSSVPQFLQQHEEKVTPQDTSYFLLHLMAAFIKMPQSKVLKYNFCDIWKAVIKTYLNDLESVFGQFN